MVRKLFAVPVRLVVLALVFCLSSSVVLAEKKGDEAKKPEDRSKILKKFDLKEDPGTDPDPERVFMRAGVPYTIVKIPVRDALPSSKGEGWVRFIYQKTRDLEVYQKTDDHYWLFVEKKPRYKPQIKYQVNDQGQRIKVREYSEEAIEEFSKFRKEFVEVTPAPFRHAIVFEESSKGLPAKGSWRNSPDTADMNGDGFIDIIAPPQRGAPSTPLIFLGDGKGSWKPWEEMSFPVALDYGSVSVGDLNGDGFLDLALAVHLRGPLVFTGDGKGRFEESSEGLPGYFPTRRLRLGDVDSDGDLDLVVSTEGPVKGAYSESDEALVKVFLNDGTASKWTTVDVNERNRTTGADWLELADLDGNGLSDIVGSSVYYGARELIHLRKGPAEWEPFGWNFFPLDSYYLALTTGKFSSKQRSDAVMGFQRSWRYDVDPDLVPPPPSGRLMGIERVSWNKDGVATRTPIVQWLGARQKLQAMGPGDFDGDGNEDVAFIDSELLELRILLGDGSGSFSLASVEGVVLPENDTYDLHVDDLDADGRDDIVLLFEATEMRKSGSIRVYLGRGVKSDGGA